MLSCSFRCNQIYNNNSYVFGHTSLWLGCSTNPPLYVEQKVMLSCNFRCNQIYNNNSYVFGHTLLHYFSRTWMFNKPTSKELHAFRITCSKRVSLKAWSTLVGGEEFASLCYFEARYECDIAWVQCIRNKLVFL
jgi:hypothetical protein